MLTIDVTLTRVDLETGSEEELCRNLNAVRGTESRLVVDQFVSVPCHKSIIAITTTSYS